MKFLLYFIQAVGPVFTGLLGYFGVKHVQKRSKPRGAWQRVEYLAGIEVYSPESSEVSGGSNLSAVKREAVRSAIRADAMAVVQEPVLTPTVIAAVAIALGVMAGVRSGWSWTIIYLFGVSAALLALSWYAIRANIRYSNAIDDVFEKNEEEKLVDNPRKALKNLCKKLKACEKENSVNSKTSPD